MTKVIKTTCPYCGVGCGLKVTQSDNAPVIEPNPEHPANRGRICTKGAALGETLDLDDRLLYPETRGRRVDWNDALDGVAEGFRRAIDRYGPDAVAFYVSGQLLTEDYYVANKLMKGFIGSANIDTNSRLCMSSAVSGHLRAFGEDIVPGCYDDLEQADLIVIAGGNSAWCHPVLFQRIQATREQRPDMKLIVIDPRRTVTADMADLHLGLKPGTDVDLFNGLFHYLDQIGSADKAFIKAHTRDHESTRSICAGSGIETVAAACDLPVEIIERFYSLFAKHERTVTLFSQGINQSSAGTDKVNAIINCHLLTGRIGKPGSGPFSLTGQPNAMGGREVGGLASTLAAHMHFDDPGAIDRLGRFWNSDRVADKPGLKAVELFEAIEGGRIKAVWIMATNPVVSLPNADRVRQALAACELVVVSDCTRTDTTQYADILLPAAAWGEKDGTVTNSERCISRQRSFLPLPGEARPDWWIVTETARRMGYTDAFPYEQPADIFNEHARLSAFENDGNRLFDIGGLADLSSSDYDALQPVQWPLKVGDTVGTARLFSGSAFPNEDKRARFIAVKPRLPAHATSDDYPLILNSGRIRDHWHTLTRTGKSPRLSTHVSEPFVAIHPDNAERLQLADNGLAEVQSRWGKVLARVRVDDGQRCGEIFIPIHWNDQFSRRARVGAAVNPVVDPLSGEPEFKSTPARVRPLPMAWYGFLLLRDRPEPAHINGLDYWVRIRGRDHWRLEMTGIEARSHWAPWARRLLGAVRPDADWLEFADRSAGGYRVASLDADGRLNACLMIATTPAALPERDWLGRLFAKIRLEETDRRALLAARAPDCEDAGATVCSCHGVGRNMLLRAIHEEGIDTPEALGIRLKAGTNCGACVPELRQLIATARPD